MPPLSLLSSTSTESRIYSQWQLSIDRYYLELMKGGVYTRDIDHRLWNTHSYEDLADQIQAGRYMDSKSFEDLIDLLRYDLECFVKVITSVMEGEDRVATVIWGSIRLILEFAQPVPRELGDVFNEFKGAFPNYGHYSQGFPWTPALKDAWLNTLTELLLFFAYMISYFYNNPNTVKRPKTWTRFRVGISQRIPKLQYCSEIINDIGRAIRVSIRKNMEDSLKVPGGGNVSWQHRAEPNFPCHIIPCNHNARFWGRAAELELLRTGLDPNSKVEESARVIAICGIGGVGKTQLALHYAETSKHLYDIIIWISAETQTKMIQTTDEFAAKIGLPKRNSSAREGSSLEQVRNWLGTTRKKFLLIFDGVEQKSLLHLLWPVGIGYSILITCRASPLASRLTTKVIQLPCFPVDDVELFYSLTGQKPLDDVESIAARDLLKLLGGLPFAMAQVGHFMRNEGCSYEDALGVFKKSTRDLFTTTQAVEGYQYTLDTVWEASIQNLPAESQDLLYLIVFFNHDIIPESILTDQEANIADPRLNFLYDVFNFGDAKAGLIRAALVRRVSSHKALLIHPLIQMKALLRMSVMEAEVFFGYAVKMLSNGISTTLNEVSQEQGGKQASWETWKNILPHINRTITMKQDNELYVNQPEVYAELLFRAGTYLWETEQPVTGIRIIEFGLSLDIKPFTNMCAHGYRILGHTALDSAQLKKALSSYLQALKILEQIHGKSSKEVADVCDSIACSYTEQGMVDEALQYLRKAVGIHNEKNPLLMSRTQAILALAYLRAWQLDESLDALQQCWRLQNLTEGQVIHSRSLKHSGDTMLLSRIKFAQGLTEEAKKLATAAMNIRQEVYGGNGPRIADSRFIIAAMSEMEGDNVQAAALLREVVEMSRERAEMQPHLARSLWFLARIEEKIGHIPEAQQLKVEAKAEREKIQNREGDDGDNDEAFMRLVPWMLW